MSERLGRDAVERMEARLDSTPHTYTIDYAIAAVVPRTELRAFLADWGRLRGLIVAQYKAHPGWPITNEIAAEARAIHAAKEKL